MASAEGDDWTPIVSGGSEELVQSFSVFFVRCKPKPEKSEATSDD
jgi:hypothetical protein